MNEYLITYIGYKGGKSSIGKFRYMSKKLNYSQINSLEKMIETQTESEQVSIVSFSKF